MSRNLKIQIHELFRAFCLGVVFAEILTHLNAHSYSEQSDEKSMQEANKMFLAFIRGEYKNQTFDNSCLNEAKLMHKSFCHSEVCFIPIKFVFDNTSF